MTAGRGRRVTMLLTEGEYAWAVGQAGKVPLTVWMRDLVLAGMVQKNSGAGLKLEVEVPRGDRRGRARTPGKFKATEDVAHEAVRKLPAVEAEMCSHDYGSGKCPIPSCRHYKWKDAK